MYGVIRVGESNIIMSAHIPACGHLFQIKRRVTFGYYCYFLGGLIIIRGLENFLLLSCSRYIRVGRATLGILRI